MTTTIDRDSTTTDYAIARKAMIDSQLRPSGVNDRRVLAAIENVAREEHVPETMRGAAYIDRSIKLVEGGAIASPVFYGSLLIAASLRSDDNVLIVDNGSGYLPALVEQMGATCEVVSPTEAAKASRKKARYSLLLIDGSVEQFPEALTKRLSDDARIVMGRVERGVTRLAYGVLTNGKPVFENRAEMGIPVLSEFAAKQEWSF